MLQLDLHFCRGTPAERTPEESVAATRPSESASRRNKSSSRSSTLSLVASLAGRAVSLHKIAQAGKQFCQRKWLGEIVVTPLLESTDTIIHRATRRQNQYGRVNADSPQAQNQTDAVHIWKSKIDDQNVVGGVVSETFRGLAIRRRIYLVPGLLQGTPQECLDIPFVFNQQESHARNISRLSP